MGTPARYSQCGREVRAAAVTSKNSPYQITPDHSINGLPNVQIPAPAEIWRDVADVVRTGISRGVDTEGLVRCAAMTAHNHKRRCELPGDTVEQFFRAHELGFEVVRHELGREVQA